MAPRATVCRVHINQHAERANRKHGTARPPIGLKRRGEDRYGHTVWLQGPSTMVYRPQRPLSCGARVWLETYGEAAVLDAGEGPRRAPTTIVHVSRAAIRANIRAQDPVPVLTVSEDGKRFACDEVEFTGELWVLYRPRSPLADGSCIWVETADPVRRLR